MMATMSTFSKLLFIVVALQWISTLASETATSEERSVRSVGESYRLRRKAASVVGENTVNCNKNKSGTKFSEAADASVAQSRRLGSSRTRRRLTASPPSKLTNSSGSTSTDVKKKCEKKGDEFAVTESRTMTLESPVISTSIKKKCEKKVVDEVVATERRRLTSESSSSSTKKKCEKKGTDEVVATQRRRLTSESSATAALKSSSTVTKSKKNCKTSKKTTDKEATQTAVATEPVVPVADKRRAVRGLVSEKCNKYGKSTIVSSSDIADPLIPSTVAKIYRA